MRRRLIPTHRGHIISAPLTFLRQEIDRFFETNTMIQGISPDFEVKEMKDGLHITAELPGLSEKDIDISLIDDVLTISGEKKSEIVKNEGTYHISERSFGSFSRSLKLPYRPTEKGISADLKEGVLTVTVPRPLNSKPEIHKIPIK
jgi:HSP20 family protein